MTHSFFERYQVTGLSRIYLWFGVKYCMVV